MAESRTASRVKDPRRERPFALAGTETERGRSRQLEIPVARLPSGSWLSLPVAILHGREPGPTVWLNAAIHGDELNGTEIIRQLLRLLDPQHLTGTVIAIPIVNVFGLVHESRYLPDRRDLNRCFPGSKGGSLASQLAHLFLEKIVKRCEFGVDFHTGSGERRNLPQIRCNLDDPDTRRYARVFGAPVILHAPLRGGSLRAAAGKLGVRILLFEAGEVLRFDRAYIQEGVEGTLRVLRALGMVADAPVRKGARPLEVRKSTWVRARRSGICTMAVRLGERVRKGQEIAAVSDIFGTAEVPLRAPLDGMVIGMARKPLVNRGDALVHLAVPPAGAP